MIPPLAQSLLSSIENLPKLVPQRRWRLAAGSTANPVDAVADVYQHRPLLLLLMTIIPPLPAPLLRIIGFVVDRSTAAGSTTTPVDDPADAAAAVRRHRPPFAATDDDPAASAIAGVISHPLKSRPSWYHRSISVLLPVLPLLPWILLLPSTATVRYCCC